MSLTKAANLSDLPENAAVAVEVDGVEIALVRTAERVFAIRDVCSHAEVALSEGEITFDDQGTPEIECWLHGSTFNLRNGCPVILPATEPVPVYPVSVDGDAVLVDVQNPLKEQEA
ncbi:MAG TPA: non-heme iron oxygenase ferredoxin subunit [Aeromicrobium sp.]|nr:non-heme iron oxygenase ferredoxin subunit [Aeromicrobium sp.]